MTSFCDSFNPSLVFTKYGAEKAVVHKVNQTGNPFHKRTNDTP